MADRHGTGVSVGNKALIGLVAGLVMGGLMAASGGPTVVSIGSGIELIGTVWINAILMTIIPLVVSKIVVSIAGAADARSIGRAGWRAMAWFLSSLTATAIIAIAVMPYAFRALPIEAAASAALKAGIASGPPPTSPGVAQTIVALVPANAIKAAADGTIVPLLVFTVAFALAASRIDRELRRHLVSFFQAIDAAITTLLQWIIACAPYGVFALGVGLAIRAGAGIVGALVYYVVVASVSICLATAVLIVVVWMVARVSPVKFVQAAGPAQVVAFGTHSSMAAFPAMLGAAKERLGLSSTATGFVLPLSLAVFKYSGPVWFIAVACFVGRIYDVPVEPSRYVGIVLTAVLTSFAVGAVPSGAVVVAAPVLAAAGVPVEAVGMLLAVDPLPNGFRTMANVTGMLAVSLLTDRGSPRTGHEAQAPAEAPLA